MGGHGSEEIMSIAARVALVCVGLGAMTLLAGCPGMPGAPGSQQEMPPGMQPPRGMESGGARTIMNAAVTAPDDAIMLVYFLEGEAKEAQWQSCRRIIALENSVMIEGLNYDGRDEAAEKDFNRLIPFSHLGHLSWRYEEKPKPAAPPGTAPEGAGAETGE